MMPSRPVPPALQRVFSEYQKRGIVVRSLQAEFSRVRDDLLRRRVVIEHAQRELQEAYDDFLETNRRWTTALEIARRIRAAGPPREPREVTYVAGLERQLAEIARDVGVNPRDVFRYL